MTVTRGRAQVERKKRGGTALRALDPIVRFKAELARAEGAGIRFPEAMALATAAPDGAPSVRMVLLKGVDERGFVFFTNLTSRKARELAERPAAALCFYWSAIDVQVRVEGTVAAVGDAEADAYFATRPRGSQIAAWVSRQSDELPSRADLMRRVARLSRRFTGEDVPRPPFWSGFRVAPARIELWFGRPDRLHERVLYTRSRGGWKVSALEP